MDAHGEVAEMLGDMIKFGLWLLAGLFLALLFALGVIAWLVFR